MKLYTIELRQNMGTYEAFKCDIGLFDRKPTCADINMIIPLSNDFAFILQRGCSMMELLSIGFTGNDKYGFRIKEVPYTALSRQSQYMICFKVISFDGSTPAIVDYTTEFIFAESIDYIINAKFNISYEKYEVLPSDIKELRDCMLSNKQYIKQVKRKNYTYVLTVNKIGT